MMRFHRASTPQRKPFPASFLVEYDDAKLFYFLHFLSFMARERRRLPVTHLYEYVDAWHKGSVWNAHCKSWYKNNMLWGKLWIWGWSALYYLKNLSEVR